MLYIDSFVQCPLFAIFLEPGLAQIVITFTVQLFEHSLKVLSGEVPLAAWLYKPHAMKYKIITWKPKTIHIFPNFDKGNQVTFWRDFINAKYQG